MTAMLKKQPKLNKRGLNYPISLRNCTKKWNTSLTRCGARTAANGINGQRSIGPFTRLGCVPNVKFITQCERATSGPKRLCLGSCGAILLAWTAASTTFPNGPPVKALTSRISRPTPTRFSIELCSGSKRKRTDLRPIPSKLIKIIYKKNLHFFFQR